MWPTRIPNGWQTYAKVSGEMGADSVTETADGYFRFANLSSARALWDGTVTAGENADGLKPPPRHMMFTVTGQDVRFKLGSAPTATEGGVLKKDQEHYFEDAETIIRVIQFFETAASAEISGYLFY